ncbi:ABC transporter substrate-binding protein [Marispirochaeta aestuarii]|uniref:ABC transporter substrate-binding protein n=1 Tax=Marispirochaeta aestuarii TaxID=1963862 RepID=A0A1Y1RWP2_9SPIO|nr:ABC transporter substrate-binding protein [Marispirochaeta aestuarii]ORC34588.1 ABC transporter substrate-binding protein [Marispirochaeta aestuarii]
MKKITCILLAALTAVCLFAEGSAEQADDGAISIGISKIVSHPALDSIEKGIQDELAELGYPDIRYDLQNANGDPNTAKQIAIKFKNDKVDIAVGIATPTSQALASTITDFPVIYSAVTDPVGAGLVTSLNEGGDNITGYSDMTPVREQIELLTRLMKVERLGHVYSTGEANAVVLAGIARDVCADMGIEFVESTVTNSSEVKQATQAILNRVDAIYVSTDNTVFSALQSVVQTALDKNIPVMSADPTSAVDYEVFAALGFDYYRHGRATGRLIARVLEGEDPSNIPTQFMSDPGDLDQLILNLDVAKKIGVTVPADIIDRASVIIENGEARSR